MAESQPVTLSHWLRDMGAALNGEVDADVPCGPCTACCASSQFVHVAPTDLDALAAIPAALLFPAPGLPEGHQLLGYDEQGRCPMLTDHRCSIYDARPQTCRTFDCRIFAATGVEPDPEKPLIARKVTDWRIDTPTERDRIELKALRAAAAFAADAQNAERYDGLPRSPTGVAVVAVETFRDHLPESPAEPR